MAQMAGRWSDADIAASLNRMGIRTGQGKTWTSARLRSKNGKDFTYGKMEARIKLPNGSGTWPAL